MRIKTAADYNNYKKKYSSRFDNILPWFPIYLKNINKDRDFNDIYILKYVNPNNHEAFYYKVSGEWGCIIKYSGFKYFRESSVGNGNFIPINVVPSSPEEFLKNNPCCKLEDTVDMCGEVWNDVVAHNNLAKEQVWDFTHGMYYHTEYYYNNKYMLYEL